MSRLGTRRSRVRAAREGRALTGLEAAARLRRDFHEISSDRHNYWIFHGLGAR